MINRSHEDVIFGIDPEFIDSTYFFNSYANTYPVISTFLINFTGQFFIIFYLNCKNCF